ncbi:MAG TPA: hypothetical protein VIY86_09935, partial [Pirellulaceae bacterium]
MVHGSELVNGNGAGINTGQLHRFQDQGIDVSLAPVIRNGLRVRHLRPLFCRALVAHFLLLPEVVFFGPLGADCVEKLRLRRGLVVDSIVMGPVEGSGDDGTEAGG